MKIKRLFHRTINRLLAPAGIMIVRATPQTIGGQSISDEQAIAEAQRRGISAGLYLEELFGKIGRAQKIIDRMRTDGAFSEDLNVVCEIGPGSGLYIEKVLEITTPDHYEVYEIAENRAKFLAREYPVISQPTDGFTLTHTPSGTVQLVHAHGVFVALQFLTSYSYFKEIVRVTAPEGYAVFDIISEDCLDEDTVDLWLNSNLRYPSFLSKKYVIDFFNRHGFHLVDDFRLPLLVQGDSCYLVFKREPK